MSNNGYQDLGMDDVPSNELSELSIDAQAKEAFNRIDLSNVPEPLQARFYALAMEAAHRAAGVSSNERVSTEALVQRFKVILTNLTQET